MSVDIRHDWTLEEVHQLFDLPFNDLLFQAQSVHRRYFDPNALQLSTLLNIKTGGCSENCGYCSQSAHFDTKLPREALLDLDTVMTAAEKAKAQGSSRFCMGAAWRNPPAKDFPKVLEIITSVKTLGMEVCATLGMLNTEQAESLQQAGLDYYNHNLDTSEAYYDQVVTTRTYQSRLDTLDVARDAGMQVCCGGIVGMGESDEDREAFLQQLANLPEHPQSVPINQLVAIEGTPMENQKPLDNLDFVATIAVARIMMPASVVRLSAGRHLMDDSLQALCFFAGANSVFSGDQLLTTENASQMADQQLFQRLGLQPASPSDMARG
jgi:biotin synthase